MTNIRALVTGAGGFVGPYLVKKLEKEGIEVITTDLGKTVDYPVDLLDKNAVKKLIENTNPELVFHLAAQSSVKLSWENPELTKRINVEGTSNILDYLSSSSKILVIGSSEVYGIPNNLPVKETAVLKPINPYGESKLEQEKLSLSHKNAVVARSFAHTGPGQLPLFVCSSFTKQAIEVEQGKIGKILTGDLSIKRDFSDVRDIVEAYFKAVYAKSDVYNICSGKSTSLKEILDIIQDNIGVKIKFEQDSSKIRKVDIPELIGDNSKFCNETGWGPSIKFSQTIKDMLEYWRKPKD